MVWPFKLPVLTKDPEPAGADSHSEDYSNENPYYRLANSLAWCLDQDPRPGEALSEFVDRCTSSVTLTELEIQSARGNRVQFSHWLSNFSDVEGYLIHDARVKKLVRQKELEREGSRLSPIMTELREVGRVRKLLANGDPVDRDSAILSQNRVQELLEEHEFNLQGLETRRLHAVDRVLEVLKRYESKLQVLEVHKIRGLLASGEVLHLDDSPITKAEFEQIGYEHRLEQKQLELARLKSQLERGESFEYDSTLVDEVDLERLEAEIYSDRSVWIRSRHRPAVQPYGVSHVGAEHLVADWLKYLGQEDVEVTQFSQDGGIDVITAEFVCQVKNYKNQNVSVQELREIFGVASLQGKKAMIFSSSSLTPSAFDFASQAGISIIMFDAKAATLTSLNKYGEEVLASGVYEE